MSKQGRPKMNFKVIGTPLPPEDKDKHKFVPVWKQEARDEKGSKKFHGAFTGGLSAGFHNTVGSREGWAPASFTSSRDHRHLSKATHCAEDYMDEEDLRELQTGATLFVSDAFKPGVSSTLVAQKGLGWEILRSTGWKGKEQDDKALEALFGLVRRQKKDPGLRTLSSGIGISVLEEDEDDDVYLYSNDERTLGEIYNGNIDSNEAKNLPTPTSRPDFKVESSHLVFLAGFVPALKKCLAEISVPAPIIPVGFKPKRPYISNRDSGDDSKHDEHRVGLSVEQRASLLGEKTIVDRDTVKVPSQDNVLKLDVATAMSAQRGYMPFQATPLKDARYRQFLDHFVSPHTVSLPSRLPNMSVSEYQREQEEFLKSASIYRPLPSAMAAKFVSASAPKFSKEAPLTPRAGLYRPETRQDRCIADVSNVCIAEPVPIQENKDQIVYGEATRQETIWIPSGSLCRIFHVDPPTISSSAVNVSKTVAPVLSLQSVKEIVSQSNYSEKVDLRSLEHSEEGSNHNIDDNDDDATVDITETLERPAMDLFKSIFCGSSSSSEDEPEITPALSQTPSLNFESAVHIPDLSITQTTLPSRKHWKKSIRKLPAVCVIDDVVERLPATAKVIPTAARMLADEDEEEEEALLITRKKTRPAASDLW